MKNKRATGAEYERKAAAYLETKGYEILEFNFHCRMGEIDIVAKDGEYLVFCEVKYRTTNTYGTPTEAISVRKKKHISKVAQYYLYQHGLQNVPIRFDVVGIQGTEMVLYKNAFNYTA